MSNTFAVNANQVMSEAGFLQPDTYFGNQDQNVLQIVALAQATALDLVEKGWMYLRKTFTINLTAATTYPFPSDWLAFVPNTAYQTGRWDPVDLPTTEETWALLKSISGLSSLPIRARLLNNTFNILNPTSGAVITIEYVSNAPITAMPAGTAAATFTSDADIWKLDDRMFQMQLKWRFKKEKGLDWQADKIEADIRVSQVMARDQGNSTITPGQTTVTGIPYANLWVP